MNWIQSAHCRSHAHCFACRNDAAFRASILRNGGGETRDFDCPEGAEIGQTDRLPHPKRHLGDIVEGLVKPIAAALGLPCLDEKGELRPESGCAKRRDALNRLSGG
jgi:hypothetical protein